MATYTISEHVEASPGVVFEAASDFENAADHIDAITAVAMLTDGPVGVGTRFRETREMFGREATEEMEVTGFDPPRSYTLHALSCGADFTTTIRFEPDSGGTRMSMEMSIRPVTLKSRLMWPLSFLFAGMMKKACAADLASLKRRVEDGPQPQMPPSRTAPA